MPINLTTVCCLLGYIFDPVKRHRPGSGVVGRFFYFFVIVLGKKQQTVIEFVKTHCSLFSVQPKV